MKNGYTKIEKAIIDSEIGTDPVALGLFLYLAIAANWATYNGLKPGEIVITIKELSQVFRMSRGTIANRLSKMEQAGIISRVKNGNITVFRIEKFISYNTSGKPEKEEKRPFDF